MQTTALILLPAPQKNSVGGKRHLEVDALRGVAVVWMILFHLSYDLYTFGREALGGPLPLPEWYWRYGAEPIGTLFFFLLGVSAWLRYQSHPTPKPFSLFFKRGAQILAMAGGLTAITALISQRFTIYFGVLHCIGASLLMLPFFLKYRSLNLILGLTIIGAGVALSQFRVSFSWLLWLGFWPEAGTGGDWYPLIPWFGVALVGIFLGQAVYPRPESSSAFTRRFETPGRITNALALLGRHSLKIYVIHQPLLLGLLYLAGIARFAGR